MITLEQLEDAIYDGTIGFCLACGEEAYGVEPDATGYKCACCGKNEVCGAEEYLIMGNLPL